MKRDGRWQYVDRTDATKITLPENTVGAYSFKDGLAVVQVDCSPKPLAEVSVHHNGLGAGSQGPFLHGVIDKSSAFIVPPKYSIMSPAFEDGLLMVGQGFDMDSQCGYINRAGEVVIPLNFQGAVDFRKGLAAVRLTSETALAKQKADEQSKNDYLNTCKNLINRATKPFYSVANLRVSVLPGEKLTVQLEKWAGPGKLREGLLTALKTIDLPPLPAVLVDQSNLEFSASLEHGVVLSQSPEDPFNAIRARLIEVQNQVRNKGTDDLPTEMLEKQWQCTVALNDWENYLDGPFTSLCGRYEKEHQAEKLKALNALAADLRPKAEKTQKQYIYNLLWPRV